MDRTNLDQEVEIAAARCVTPGPGPEDAYVGHAVPMCYGENFVPFRPWHFVLSRHRCIASLFGVYATRPAAKVSAGVPQKAVRRARGPHQKTVCFRIKRSPRCHGREPLCVFPPDAADPVVNGYVGSRGPAG